MYSNNFVVLVLLAMANFGCGELSRHDRASFEVSSDEERLPPSESIESESREPKVVPDASALPPDFEIPPFVTPALPYPYPILGGGGGASRDLCLGDSTKTQPGVCGCGVPDIDTDGDATFDCDDSCPIDPTRTEPEAEVCSDSDDNDCDGLQDCQDSECSQLPACTQADLGVSKIVDDPTPAVGATVTFTITLTNAGPDTATNVFVNDVIPPGLSFVSAIPTQGSYDSVTGVWTLGSVAPGAPQTLGIQVIVVAPTATTNTATIAASDQFDSNLNNNSDDATVTPSQVDLALTKTVSDNTPNVGDLVTFTITLANQSFETATNVAVTDLIPPEFAFVSAAPSQGSYNPVTGLWAVGSVFLGVPQTLPITATVLSPSVAINTATISASDQLDPDTSNNSASATSTPQQADLMVTKTVDNATPSLSSQVTFTITLTNNGPDVATNVSVTDLIPVGFFTLINASVPQGTYNPITGVWTVGSLSVGAPLTLTLQVLVTSSSPSTNTASISASDQFDPSALNNSASVAVTPAG